MAQAAAVLMSTCPQTEVNDYPTSSGVEYGQHLDYPAVFGPLDWNYHYKSVDIKISLDNEFAPISYTGLKFRPYRGWK